MKEMADDLFKDITEKAVEINDIPPLYAFLVPMKEDTKGMVLLAKDGDKRLLAEGIRKELRRNPQFEFYLLVGEVWYAVKDKDWKPTKGYQVKDMEDKREALMILGESRDGETYMLRADIQRSDDGKISGFAKREEEVLATHKQGYTGGTLSNLFEGPIDPTVGAEFVRPSGDQLH